MASGLLTNRTSPAKLASPGRSDDAYSLRSPIPICWPLGGGDSFHIDAAPATDWLKPFSVHKDCSFNTGGFCYFLWDMKSQRSQTPPAKRVA
jgi:hypothetical protein